MSPVWDSETGFGGNGNKSDPRSIFNGYCVADGPFAGLELRYLDKKYHPHCLAHGFEAPEVLARLGPKVGPTAVEELLHLSDYESFNLHLERGSHSGIPLSIRGDFTLFTAPNGVSVVHCPDHIPF